MRPIIYFALIGLCVAQEELCPPPEILHPCVCYEIEKWIRCDGIQDSFNLKGIFDNASSYVNDDVTFNYLSITRTGLEEIEEGAVLDLKFENVNIYENPELVHISPRAFGQKSRAATIGLDLHNNAVENDMEIFEFVQSFSKLEELILIRSEIDSIPDNAFQNMRSLREIIMYGNGITQIGSQAFSGPMALEELRLFSNSLPSEGLPADAFSGISSSVIVHLWDNGLEFLEKKSYKPLLDKTGSFVMGIPGTSSELFHCDQRVDWLCEKESYKKKLEGYLCKEETGFADIWEYCSGRKIGSGLRDSWKED